MDHTRALSAASSLTGILATAALVVTVGTMGCASSASLPPAAASVDPGQRAPTYDRFKLDYTQNFWTGSRWKRSDGEYMLGQLDKVLAAYPETNPGVERIRSRGTVIGLLGGIGGGVLGYTLGRNLTAPENRRWSSGQQAAGYGIGAGLILTSFLVQALWTDPGPDMTASYNKALHQDLVQR